MLVAPATGNIIAKVAHGLCDDLVSLMICAAACPVVFAPAMNNRMWDHPVAQENVDEAHEASATASSAPRRAGWPAATSGRDG